jgi:hypothetical protein
MAESPRGRAGAVAPGDPKPEVMVLKDLEPILHLGTTRVWQLEKAGELAFLEILPRIGNKARYSGKKVQAWIDGELAAPPRAFSFGKGRR